MQPESSAVATTPHNAFEDPLLQELERQLGVQNFNHWFRDKVALNISSDQVRIGVGSPFLLNWMQKRFRREATRAAQTVLGPSAQAFFEVDARLALNSKQSTRNAPSPSRATSPAPRPANSAELVQATVSKTSSLPAPIGALAPTLTASKPAGSRSPRSNSKRQTSGEPRPEDRSAPRSGRRYADLAEFVEGPCNELAATAARQVCDAPGSRFNPLFLHGGVGTGKTHLLEGIYRRLRRSFPSLQVMYLTAEAFANYFTQALREHTLPSFRQRFRNVDVLLVDDIDFLNSKRVIQEEFLHTFKHLESHGRQVVLSSDRHPRLLSKMSDELTTRFLSGLVCRLEACDQLTRQRIVERKAESLDAELAPEVLTFVAQRFRNNVRELEGALNCLQTYYHMTRKRVGLPAARKVLADLERDCIRIVRMTDIENAVCSLFGVEPQALKSPSRTRSISHPRMLAMFLARKHTQAAYSEIGEYFGGRNHSTVMSAERKVQHWLGDQTTIKIASRHWQLDEVVETLEHQLQVG